MNVCQRNVARFAHMECRFDKIKDIFQGLHGTWGDTFTSASMSLDSVNQGHLYQGSYRSWKTWKVMEFVISISRPGKSWNLSEGHGKAICLAK